MNGFLVDSIESAAERIIHAVKKPGLRETMGSKARETVRSRFLMTRLMEDWLDLIASFEPQFLLRR